ncbi:MAG: LPS-assembly protein LptD [Pseudomonadota bacterium]
MRFRLSPVALSLLCLFPSVALADEDGMALRLDRTFKVLPESQEPMPVFVRADELEGKPDDRMDAKGHAELRQQGMAVWGDFLRYDPATRDVAGQGHVRIEQNGNVLLGPEAKLNLDTSIGDMPTPSYTLGENQARGEADTLHLEDKQHYTMRNATYTTCPVGNDDWKMHMGELRIDRERQIGEASNAYIEFKGTPILYTPWMDFPLNDQRKSGFLGPTFGSTSKGGSEITIPYYWNIAPDMDATISPRAMFKRGVLLQNEFRYLESGYKGKLNLDYLPNDSLTRTNRSRFSLLHQQSLGAGFAGSINYSRVSDNDYLRDFSTAITGSSQVNLIQDGSISYGAGWWSSALRFQRFQTLQDPAAPIGVPYRRLPQLTLTAMQDIGNANLDLKSEYVDFRHPTAVNGQRIVFYPSAAYPLLNEPGYFVTPKIGMHSTHYALGVNNNAGLPATASRNVPIFSLDSGMVFERDTEWSGDGYIQTLEPRAYYVYVPYRNQANLPVFDTVQVPFNFAQIFSENRFFGSDRVGDANQVTAAMISRLIQGDDGFERIRFALGQRFSFLSPQVNLVAPTTTNNKSDVLLAITGRPTKEWTVDASYQYNPSKTRSEVMNASLRYQPEPGKVLNASYRYTRNTLRQVDLSTQWPLTARWDAVGRWNFSLQDGRLLEALGGVEYNQDCWTLRFVAQRYATTVQQSVTGFFIQLEMNGLMRVGSDALAVLRTSVPGYAKTNEMSADQAPQGLQ